MNLKCDSAYLVVVSTKTIIGTECIGSRRDFIITESNEYLPNPKKRKGHIEISATDSYKQFEGNSKTKVNMEEEFLSVSGILTTYNWFRLEVFCSSSGELIYDSGKVTENKGYCDYTVDGSKDRKEIFFLEGKEIFKEKYICN